MVGMMPRRLSAQSGDLSMCSLRNSPWDGILERVACGV
jgi:hypothetical protein